MRGSTGYGKTYVALDNGVKREDSVKDIGALLDWIATQPDLDAKRVVVYRRLATAATWRWPSLTHFTTASRGGIDVVGISNFVTFLENTAATGATCAASEYGDERDPKMREFLRAHLAAQQRRTRSRSRCSSCRAQNDPRVPLTEAEQIVATVRAQRRRRSGTWSASTRATASPSATTSTTTSGRSRCS